MGPDADKPLSNSQLLIWTGQKLRPDEPLYNMVLAFDIEGDVDIDAFRTAFQFLVDGSDAMRTRVVERDGRPSRIVERSMPDGLEVHDWSKQRDARARVDLWIDERSRRNFRLDERLFAAALFAVAPGRYVWYLNQHHLITDGWSTALSFRRLAELYRAVCRGEQPDVSSAPRFESYVEHERGLRGTPAHEAALAHWQAKLADPYQPTDFYGEVPANRSARTERVEYGLGAERSARLRALACEPGFRALTRDLSLFNLFASALFAFLHRVDGHRDLAILAPAHNRPTRAFKDTIGLFIEILPLHTHIDRDETWKSLHAKVAREAQSFLGHARPGASSALATRSYDVLMNYINASFGDLAGLPVRSEWVHPGYGDPRHSLRLQVHDFDEVGEFLLHFDFNCDVFSLAERELAVAQFVALLDALLADPGGAIADVSMLAVEDRDAQVVEFNSTEASSPFATVLAAIDRRIELEPDAVAIVDGDERLTFRELDARAGRLARRIRRAEPGNHVGVLLERSAALVTSILAILRAGAAYVPLDPAHPDERIATLLRDSGAALVVTDTRHTSRLPDGVSQLDVDDDDGADAVLPEVGPADHAYVLYTSGSTGRPKGVLVDHRALANYVQWAAGRYDRGEALTWALYSPISVDLTVTSLFVPLVAGGTIAIYGDVEDGDLAIQRVLADDAVDVIKLTPTHLTLLREQGRRPHRLSRLIVGGENLRTALARGVQDLVGESVEIYNEYGPTESTVACTIHRFDTTRDTGSAVPIGRPIANTRVYVLDDAERPVAAGIAGELCVAGAGVAVGYLGAPDATDAVFVPDPFHDGERMYRTGDLVRRDPTSGALVFLGRGDDQVKIRGARVELAEVEAVLASHPDVATCVAGVVDATPAASTAVQHDDLRYCTRCGLASSHPASRLDGAGVCAICRDFDGHRDEALAYFGTLDDLRRELDGATECVMLLSGGKDSTYALYRLVELGVRPIVFSLDNGYISEHAKANIRRAVDDLGLELVVGQTPSMNAIFADSLTRFSNVCQGCFKTIYTLATNLAHERGLHHVVTGLSRGQIFETRLAGFFKLGVHDPAEIDRLIVEARKAYHRVDDAVARLLDVSLFADDRVFDEIRFVDFYRYCDVGLDDVLSFLRTRAPWVRPEDTGRSTNCLINDSGIWVHKRERGFHNYALPYSWDVRLGHKDRDEALAELDDTIDEAKVQRTLREIGYEAAREAGERKLVAYWVPGAGRVDAHTLREYLALRVPSFMVPSHFVELESIPTTAHGKVDRAALPKPGESDGANGRTAPHDATEQALVRIWQDVLRIETIGVEDDFLELGGDSIQGIQIVARARRAGIRLTPRQVFDEPTIARLARVAVVDAVFAADDEPAFGSCTLTPIQRWFLAQSSNAPDEFAQWLRIEATAPLDRAALEAALQAVVTHHDALRSCFDEDRQTIPEPPGHFVLCATDDPRALARELDLGSGRLVAAGHAGNRVTLVVHHLVVDALSWLPLLEDLDAAYDAASRGRALELPPKTKSWRAWSVRADGDGTTYPLRGRDLPERRALRTLTRRVEATPNEEKLVRTLADAIRAETGCGARIDVEGHGRGDGELDVARTVGWFTTLTPIEVGETDDDRRVEVLFNFLGRADALVPAMRSFRPASRLDVTRAPGDRCTHALEVHALVEGGELEVVFTHVESVLDAGTVGRVADRVADALRTLMPSDFPEADLSQGELDDILREFGER